MKNHIMKKSLSLLLCFALVLSYIPVILVSTTVAANEDTRLVDASTMDKWTDFFGSNVNDTHNAGRVWMDKSVFTNASAFPAGTVQMTDSEKNFLVALSAISANKEVVGYSTIPTDTILVLDVSGSMENNADELVKATNNALKTLLDENENNRVGVVLYSASSYLGATSYSTGTTLLLPLDRYTPAKNGEFLTLSNNTVSTHKELRNSSGGSISKSKTVVGGTYIQAGLYEAMREFQKADPIVEGNNFQGGQKRIPILVLMSDGAPTTATTNFASVNSGNSNVGNGLTLCATNELAFLTQLTASYVLNKIETHYDRVSEGLFYTLGLGVGEDSSADVAISVLDPKSSTPGINNLWRSYLNLSAGRSLTLSVHKTENSNNPGKKNVTVQKNTNAVNQFYTDEYFYAQNADQLAEAFQSIVDEILIQSRYYPTSLQGGHPDFSGYITFTDRIGDYMDIKDIKGILIGNTLFDGHMMASQFSPSGALGSIENPSELGLEFIESVRTRLNITDDAVALDLVTNAYLTKQLYSDNSGWSNYIGWYASADGSFLGHYNEGTTSAPAGAVYKVRSYGFLGKSEGNIKDSDMMYMTVQLRINIESGEETLIWKIPAALVPIVTYKVSLTGTSLSNATNVKVTREEADPIRLIYEVGLDERYNELNISDITESKHVQADGSRIFWTNHWDNSASEHIDHVATYATFTPSTQNELYYYISDSLIYERVNGQYVPLTRQGTLDKSKTYYHAYYVFSTTSSTPVLSFLQIHKNTIEKAVWDDEYEISANDSGAYIIPIGTPYQQIEEEQFLLKSNNVTGSIHYSEYPYVNINNSVSTAGVKLGNNGLLTVKPATGIKLSKLIDTVEPGASDLFSFRITLKDAGGTAVNGTYGTLLADIGSTNGYKGTVTFTDGEAIVELNAGKTLFITGIPTGSIYTVEETGENSAYKVKTVHVNGKALSGETASGVIANLQLEAVDFLNTPVGDGNLVITKNVKHPFGSSYQIPSAVKFTAKVTLTSTAGPLANEEFELVRASGITTVRTDANGEFTVKLSAGESVSIHAIPERTEYTVTEIDIPDGFTLAENESTALGGEITEDGSTNAVLVNRYNPDPVSPEITVSVTKSFTGRDWKAGDAFEFIIERLNHSTGEVEETVASLTVNNAAELTKSIKLSNEVYTAAGVYHYRITERIGSEANGITYDTAMRLFHVHVGDADMDGKLEITSVENVIRTVVTKEENAYTVSAAFANTYAPYVGTNVDINVKKEIAGHTFPKNGFTFGLYDESGTELVMTSTVTNANGDASFRFTYAATDVGVHVYKLREIAGSINGMAYDTTEYTVTVTVTDNGDGTTSATTVITKDGSEITGAPVFTNVYVPQTASFVISGSKILTGRDMNEGEFEFELYSVENGAETLIQTAYNLADGDFIFETLTFDRAGEYFFKLRERNTGLGGVTYDNREYSFTVTVVDENGVLVASSDLSGSIEFNNVYKPQSTSISLGGNKTLEGRDINNGEFSFTLTGPDGYSETKTNVGGKFSFGSITFDKAGVYVYTVSENVGKLGGITYDKSVYTVTVTVTDDSAGKLHASISYAKGGHRVSGISFNNTYKPASVKIELGGNKQLTGRDAVEGEFEFVLSNAINGLVIESTRNTASSTFRFTPYEIHTKGVYVFNIKETDTGRGGVTYDTSVYTVKITVADDLNGNLFEESRVITRNGESADSVVFENVYKATSATVAITASKILSGRDIKDGEFSFTLSGNGITDTKKNLGNTVSFEELTFDKAGTYVYTVTENAGNLGGITYDASVYTVTVTVRDNGRGVLIPTVSYEKDSQAADGITFTNTYSASKATVIINGTKELSGRDIKDGEFSFTLKGNNYSDTKKNVGKAFTFDTLTFDKVGTYVYTVTEDAGTLGGVTYDTTVYTVTVVVTDNGEGKLVASVSYANGNDKVDSISFKNSYSSSSVTVTLKGDKELTGRDIRDGEFSFTLSGNGITDTKKNVGKTFTFDTLTFDKVGTYVYTVTENAGNLGGVTYDTTVYTVTVVVTDNGEGKLVASVSYAKGNEAASGISFKNSYSSTSVTVTISGNKELIGRDIKDGEFSFTLKGDNYSDTKKNVGKAFTFDTLTFDKVGTYVYTVTENAGNLGGVTYDTTVYTVTVVVTDDGEGKLVASVSYAKGNDTATGITFNNGYKSSSVKVTFTGIKNLEGRDLKADEFMFMLFNADDKFTVNGDAFDLVKNLADGSFSFKALEFDKIGTWYYVVKEDTSAEEKGMTYDTTVYRIKVTVTDNGEGQLVASVEISTDEGAVNGIAFNNVYEEPFVPSPETGDETAIGIFLMMLTVTSIGFIAIKSKKRRIAE